MAGRGLRNGAERRGRRITALLSISSFLSYFILISLRTSVSSHLFFSVDFYFSYIRPCFISGFKSRLTIATHKHTWMSGKVISFQPFLHSYFTMLFFFSPLAYPGRERETYRMLLRAFYWLCQLNIQIPNIYAIVIFTIQTWKFTLHLFVCAFPSSAIPRFASPPGTVIRCGFGPAWYLAGLCRILQGLLGRFEWLNGGRR